MQLIDLSPREDDLIRFCLNTESVPLKFFLSRYGWSIESSWTMNTQNVSTLQVFQSFYRKCKNLFLHCCLEKFIWFLCECIVNIPKGNLKAKKYIKWQKFRTRSLAFFENNHLEAKKRSAGIEKIATVHKGYYSSHP